MNLETLDLLSGRLYWQPLGEAGYIDFGNVFDYKNDPERQRVPHSKASGGLKRVDVELLRSAKERRTFTMTEHFEQAVRMLNYGTRLTDLVQAAEYGLTRTFGVNELTVDRVYDLGRVGVLIQSASYSGGNLVEGVDYENNPGSGLIRPLSATHFGSNEWTFEFDCPLLTRLNYRALDALLTQGTFRFFESDQIEGVPKNAETFTGQVQVTGWGENNLEDYNKWTLEVLSRS